MKGTRRHALVPDGAAEVGDGEAIRVAVRVNAG
jgi:hypothetical protein